MRHQCYWCGESLVWQRDVDADEFFFDGEVEGICAVFQCPECESMAIFTPSDR